MTKQFRALVNLFRYWQSHAIASRDLCGTVSRFICWQVGTRLLRCPVVFPWIEGTSLVVERGMTGATMNVYGGLHEFEEMAFLLHFLRGDDGFVDIGANVGTYTILAAGVVGAQSVAVEPVPNTFSRLQRNVRVNDLGDRVRAHQVGVGKIDGGELKFIADQDTTNRVAEDGYAGRTVQVPIRSLDSLLAGFESVLWKVDVEGFEEEVLAGAGTVLDAPALLAVQLEAGSQRIWEIMEQHGFECVRYNPFDRRLVGAEAGTVRRNHNWLWVRDRAAVEARCQSARKFTVHSVTF